MRAPQVVMIVLLTVGLCAGMVDHGKPKTGKNNFLTTVIAVIIQTAILWWGGFWK